MNKQEQIEAFLLDYLQTELDKTQSEFKGKMSTKFALEGIGEYEGAVREHSELEMKKLIFKFKWLEKQIDNLTLVF